MTAHEEATEALLHPPLIAIEVLSPTDTYADLKSRASDLHAMGTQNVWLIDPDLRTAEVWTGQNWQPHTGTILRAASSPMHPRPGMALDRARRLEALLLPACSV